MRVNILALHFYAREPTMEDLQECVVSEFATSDAPSPHWLQESWIEFQQSKVKHHTFVYEKSVVTSRWKERWIVKVNKRTE